MVRRTVLVVGGSVLLGLLGLVQAPAQPAPPVSPSDLVAVPPLALPGFPGFLLAPGEHAEHTPPGVRAIADAPAGSACSERSWTGGTTEWCGGALVYRDHVYDDTGADTAPGSIHGAASSPATGDVDHRAHGQQANSADLLVLRVRPVDGGLQARLELNTLFPGDATLAALAVDLDDDRGTGGGPWDPRVDVRSAGWDVVGVLDARDPEANVIEGVVPLTLPATGVVRLQAVVALGDGTPMNVAFRAGETGAWWEARQAAALAAGDVSAFGRRVDVADLRAGHDHPAPARSGLQSRVHRSDRALGEGLSRVGIVGETGSRWTHLGHHQPYALYVPDPIPQDAQLVLHGAGSSGPAVLSPGMRSAFGDGQRRILVAPFGRGDTGGFLDWSLDDVWSALADAEATFATDPGTRIVSGYSMGGAAALQLAAWFPDRFAAAIGWVPFTGDCLQGTPLAQGVHRPPVLRTLAPLDPANLTSNDPEARSGCPLGTRGNVLDLAENLRHVPTAVLFGATDELVWVNHALATADRFAALGIEHRLWLHLTDHFVPAALDRWEREAEWSAGRRRPDRVAEVRYRSNVFHRVEELGIVPDGAYWVDDISPRHAVTTPEGDAVVALRSEACPAEGGRAVEVRRDVGTSPTPWLGQRGVIVERSPTSGADRIVGTLTNVASVTVDVDGACIGPRPVQLDVVVDGPTEVRFSDGRPPAALLPATGSEASRSIP